MILGQVRPNTRRMAPIASLLVLSQWAGLGGRTPSDPGLSTLESNLEDKFCILWDVKILGTQTLIPSRCAARPSPVLICGKTFAKGSTAVPCVNPAFITW